jgi:hypothetical protein
MPHTKSPIDRGLRLEAERRGARQRCLDRAEGWAAEARTYTDRKRVLVCEALALGERKQALMIELLDAFDRADVKNESDLVEGGATTRDAAAYRVRYEAGRRVYVVTRRADGYYAIVPRRSVDDASYPDPAHPVYLADAIGKAKAYDRWTRGA